MECNKYTVKQNANLCECQQSFIDFYQDVYVVYPALFCLHSSTFVAVSLNISNVSTCVLDILKIPTVLLYKGTFIRKVAELGFM